jgi:hypothetical protein
MDAFHDLEDLLRKAYNLLAEENGDSELIEGIQNVLSLCAMRRECSEINEVEFR